MGCIPVLVATLAHCCNRMANGVCATETAEAEAAKVRGQLGSGRDETTMSVSWETMERLLVWRFEQLKLKKPRKVKVDFKGRKMPEKKMKK